MLYGGLSYSSYAADNAIPQQSKYAEEYLTAKYLFLSLVTGINSVVNLRSLYFGRKITKKISK